MNDIEVNPNLSNFIRSLRDMGYSFEVAVADIIDNSISAQCKNIKTYAVVKPKVFFSLLDDGFGMNEEELIEAMRLATKNPNDIREKRDLGRFGLGLKTASFSQCKRLTVISKKQGEMMVAKQWNLDYIAVTNKWLLITPTYSSLEGYYLVKELEKSEQGTLVIWEDIDRYSEDEFSSKLSDLRVHLSLVFHRFLEGNVGKHRLSIEINNNLLHPFNPFNANNLATQEFGIEKINIEGTNILVQPFILPHHSKVAQREYEEYATKEGYLASQGFYLYRCNRLLVYGTWWGLHKATDAHKLVRIKIDISNNQDYLWGIDIKKSSAKPINAIKSDLKRIINQITSKSARMYSTRGRRVMDNSINRFWELVPTHEELRFKLNLNHPLYLKLIENMAIDQISILETYLQGVQAFLPLEAIQAQLQEKPYALNQESLIREEEVIKLANRLMQMDLSRNEINELLKTEMFKDRKELFKNEKQL